MSVRQCCTPLTWYSRLLGIGMVLFCTCLTVVPIWAQDLQHPKYRWQERTDPDRWEGLKAIEISGERIDLLAAFLTATAAAPPQAAETSYYLGFYLPQAEPQVRIALRDYQRFPKKYHYWMQPKRQQYPSGFQKFAWEATLLRELHIPLEEIGAVARVSDASAPVVAPLLLSSTPLTTPLRLQGCRFVLLPRTTMHVDYVVYARDDRRRELFKKSAQEWDKGHKQTIAWSGRDAQGKPVAAGWYGLKVTATAVQSGQPKEPPLILDWLFYYTPEIRG